MQLIGARMASSRRMDAGQAMLFCALPMLAAAPSTSAQVTGRQGEIDPNAFHGSMVLEVPFLPAAPTHRTKDWVSSPADIRELRKFSCDRISITNLEFRTRDTKG